MSYQQNHDKKYSKISPALKCCFLECLYFQGMTIKDAAIRCKLNYSTAKVIIRDLNHKERRFVKTMIKAREDQLKKGDLQNLKICGFKTIPHLQQKGRQGKELSESAHTSANPLLFPIEIISRVGYDFFSKEEKSQ